MKLFKINKNFQLDDFAISGLFKGAIIPLFLLIRGMRLKGLNY
jgi:hypothetical protein